MSGDFSQVIFLKLIFLSCYNLHHTVLTTWVGGCWHDSIKNFRMEGAVAAKIADKLSLKLCYICRQKKFNKRKKIK